jgi:hypothetical protein
VLKRQPVIQTISRESNPNVSEVQNTPQKTSLSLATSDHAAHPSPVHDLQDGLSMLMAGNPIEAAAEKVPLRYTIIGLVAFCSAFWFMVASALP